MLGRILGNYRVTAKVGEGGTGEVYAAEHVTIGRRAAVKVLLPELSYNPEIVRRFFNEARASTAIQHPGIVEVFDFGYDQEQRGYIVMEFLKGESLAARLRRVGRLTPDHAAHVARQAAGALGAAHEAGIVHRDFKPDNVFLVPDPEVVGGERVKVLDFGMAKLAPETGSVAKTRTGAVIGTPLYMSPEQCRGVGEVDHRSDIYSLGCVLFELLCGRPPFPAEGAGEVMAFQMFAAAPAPRSLDPAIPDEIEALVMHCLAKEPARRPQTMGEVIAAIDAMPGLRTIWSRPTSVVPSAGGSGLHALATPYPGAPYPGTPPVAPAAASQPPSPSSPSHTPSAASPSQLPTTQMSPLPGWQQPYGVPTPTTLIGAAAQSISAPAPPPRRGLLGPLIGVGTGVAVIVAFAVVRGGGAGRSAAPRTERAATASADPATEPPAPTPAPAPAIAPPEPPTMPPTPAPADPTPPTPTATPPEATPTPPTPATTQTPAPPDPTPAPAPPDPMPIPIPTPPPTPPDPTPAAPVVHLTIRSDPDGAKVLRATDGVLLGRTPATLTVPQGDAPLRLVVRRAGYRDETIAIATDRDGEMTTLLRRRERGPRHPGRDGTFNPFDK